MFVFRKGACGVGVTSFGAILFEEGMQPEAFGAVAPQGLVDMWKTRDDQDQVIGQAEFNPLIVARLTWSGRMTGRRVIYFIDNDSARMASIKSYSPAKPSLEIVMSCVEWDGLNNSTAWYARVPTESNIADAPSRMDRTFCNSIRGRTLSPVLPNGWVPTDVL